MKLSKRDAKTLVELLLKANKDVTFDDDGYIKATSGKDGDIMYFDIQHLDDASLDEISKYIAEFNNVDINDALHSLNSALKEGIEALEEVTR